MATTLIGVYADWADLKGPLKLGTLSAYSTGAAQAFEFEFSAEALNHPEFMQLQLDPKLGFYAGRQFPAKTDPNFGAFLDASPDRWGRLLMNRRFERARRKGDPAEKRVRLLEADYLLGVHDAYRVGALRFKRGDTGEFLDDNTEHAAPPFVRLRELEHASRALEQDDEGDLQIDDWLRMLIAPGGSLGGARPKASVADLEERLWIAKFPSVKDEVNVGAWEMLVYSLAGACELRVAPAQANRYASPQHTFLIRRFDRTDQGQRLHFASAMTLTGHKDGDDASTGASYLELAEVLISHGAQTDLDLHELWSRIVFSMLVSNTDDHLRNHGFILVPGQGWRLSELYDVNPVPLSTGLKLNVSEADNVLDLELARSVAPVFRLSAKEATAMIEHMSAIVRQWPKLAADLGLTAREQAAMADAFCLAG